MIRILEGIRLRIREMTTLPTPKTKSTEKDMTMAGSNLTVIAKAEQIPNTCTVIGLSSLSGLEMSFLFFFENKGSDFFFSRVCVSLMRTEV